MAIQIYTVELKSTAPYSQSAFFKTPKDSIEEKLSADEFDKRFWKEKAHADPASGQIFIPPTAVKRSIDEACAREARTVKGKGKNQYKKYVVAGTAIVEPILITDHAGKIITLDTMGSEITMCDSQGKKGGAGGSTVPRKFPLIPTWQATVPIYIYDETITSEGRGVYEGWVRDAGLFIGLGRFRPQNGGYYGRFEVVKGDWSTI